MTVDESERRFVSDRVIGELHAFHVHIDRVTVDCRLDRDAILKRACATKMSGGWIDVLVIGPGERTGSG